MILDNKKMANISDDIFLKLNDIEQHFPTCGTQKASNGKVEWKKK